MGFFGIKSKNRYLGVDIGTSNLKIVELNRWKGGVNLSTYGAIDLADDVIRSDSPAVREKICKSLQRIVKESGAKGSRAIASLPGFSVFTTILNLPKMEEEELASAVKWESKRYIPFPIEEIILDWEVITPKSSRKNQKAEALKPQEGIEVFLTAVPKNIVKRYGDVFKKANLELVGLEPEAMALARVLVDTQKEGAMIVDIGATATEICIIEDGFPKLNLSVDMGGNALTRVIAHSLQVSFERAEQFKKDFGVSREKMGGEIPRAIKPVIDVIVEKIRHCLNLFYNRGGSQVSQIILSGGSAKLPEFTSYLSLFLDNKIVVADPWSKIIIPQELKKVLDELGPTFDVAVGLALRELLP
ncbi:MAG: type IV pilus assembly protein PilM [Patescibacteria group bacterium]|nr:type IV pilus assembly protein PilM [Patescibacteria group bacterium]